MKKKAFSAFIILSITLFANAKAISLNYNLKSGTVTKHNADTSKSKKLKLVWSDEFNYSGFPDSTKWTFEEGLVRNHEKQFYTKGRKANAVVKDGFLFITAIKEPFINEAYRAGSNSWQRKDSLAYYTSASINTKGKADWKYGKITIRAKLPAGKGVWPAIWMLGSNIAKVGWPVCGEIDIMENVGFEHNRVYATMHYLDPATNKPAQNMKHTLSETLSNEFHIYTLEWDEKSIKVYLDDTLYQAFNIDDAGTGINGYRQKQYLLLNLALGGDWGGKIDDQIFPQQFVIDYVRVYQ